MQCGLLNNKTDTKCVKIAGAMIYTTDALPDGQLTLTVS